MAILSKSAILGNISTLLADNSSGDITPAVMRTMLTNMVESYEDYIPHLTQAQINALTPTNGQWVYNTDLSLFEAFNGIKWVRFITTDSVQTGLFRKKVLISREELLHANTTPILLLEGQGVGTVIQVLCVLSRFTYGTTPYISHTDLEIDNGDGSNICGLIDIGTSGDVIFSHPIVSINLFENQDLFLTSHSGDPMSGDGTLEIELTYQIL